MANLGLYGTSLASFKRDIYAKGLDLNTRSKFTSELPFPVANGTTLRAGQWVKLDANGYIVPCNAVDDKPLGMSKWQKQSLAIAMATDVPLTVVAGGTVTLTGYTNIPTLGATGEIIVKTAKNGGGTTLDGPAGYGAGGSTDFTAINLVNGTITFAAVPANTVNGAVVYASFAFTLTTDQMNVDGKDFHNQQLDDVTLGGDMMNIAQDFTQAFTTEFEPNVATWYAIGNKVYLSANGRVTTASGGGATEIGTIISVPSAVDPFIGYQTRGGPF